VGLVVFINNVFSLFCGKILALYVLYLFGSNNKKQYEAEILF